MKPLVSVIITCYNYGRFLDECIRSALSQSYEAIEIIVVNDGSTDDTADVCSRFANRILVHNQSNMGVADAMNAGIRMSHGDFFYFLSADDKLFHDTIRQQIEVMQHDNECAIVCGNGKLIDAQGSEIGDNCIPLPTEHLLVKMFETPNLHDGSLLFRRSCLEKINGLFFEPYENYHGFHHKCFRLARDFAIRYINDFLVYQRVHTENLSHPKNTEKMIAGYEVLRMMMREYVQPEDLFNGLNVNDNSQMAMAYVKIAYMFFLFGQYDAAYSDLRQATDLCCDILDQTITVPEMTPTRYFYPLGGYEDSTVPIEIIQTHEFKKDPDVEGIMNNLRAGNTLKAFYQCRRGLEENPDKNDLAFLISQIFVRQLQIPDSVNRFHKITIDLLKQIQKKDPLHSVDLYLWLAFLDENSTDSCLEKVTEQRESLRFFDLRSCLWLMKLALALHKEVLFREILSVFKRVGLSINFDKQQNTNQDEQGRKLLGQKTHISSSVSGDTIIKPHPYGPMVSVIVSTYNRPERLQEAIRSILAQSYQDFEIVVINDGGHDIEAIISDLNKDVNKIVYVKYARNKGLSAARNTGIMVSRGKYIAYLDDDDIFYPDHLETLVGCLEKNNYQVAYADAYRAHQVYQNGSYEITDRDVPYSIDFSKDLLLSQNITPINCLMHAKQCLDEVGLFDEDFRTHEDWELLVRLSRKYDFIHIKKVTTEFRWMTDGSTKTSNSRPEFLRTMEEIFMRYQSDAQGKQEVIQRQKSSLMYLRGQVAQQERTKKCSIIIPVLNKLELTKQCLEALCANTPGELYEVIIIDNASSDCTADFLSTLEGNVRVITNKEPQDIVL